MESKETDNLYGNDNVNHTLLYDPIEDTPEFMQIKDELIKRMEVFRVEYVKEAERVYEEIGVWPPISHRLCLKQKEILQQEYGIEWKTPEEMNPDVNFD